MGYRGKVEERARARELRAQAWTLADIAEELGVSKSSVSIWVRDVEFEGEPRSRSVGRARYGARRRGPNALQRRKQREIAELIAEGRERIGMLSERDFLIAGVAVYAGEGGKTENEVNLPNSDPRFLFLFAEWLRHFFDIDETRLRVRLYLHEELDLDAATAFWSEVTGVPSSQFTRPYRAAADASIRHAKHPYGCATLRYGCARTHRSIMGLVHGLMSPRALGLPDLRFDDNGCGVVWERQAAYWAA